MAQLAARCPACNTVFRVVPDQLRVSDGWVRCGRCSEVFNAGETLIDLDTGAPTRVADEPRAATPPIEPEVEPEAPPPAGVEFDLQIVASAPAPLAGVPAAVGDPIDPAATSALDPRAEPEDRPSFVRRAERAELWRRPKVQAALAALALLLALGLAALATFEYRDLIAARAPGLRPALERMCAPLACRVGPVHAIDSLALESSGLVRVEKSNVYKLQLALRNRSDIAVALPALDLSLTDSQGKLLARRVLRAAELGVKQDTLAAGRELALQATLQAATEPVAGYTLELFYP